jgi:uncharacterized integral membrane protein
MRSMTRSRAAVQPEADAVAITDPAAVAQGPAAVEELAPAPGERAAQPVDTPVVRGETRRGHSRRMARRTRLHGYAVVAVALFAFVVALAAANTGAVKVSWLFGASHVSLVWLVLATAILGWLLGLVTNAALHRRTRAPRAARPQR